MLRILLTLNINFLRERLLDSTLKFLNIKILILGVEFFKLYSLQFHIFVDSQKGWNFFIYYMHKIFVWQVLQ